MNDQPAIPKQGDEPKQPDIGWVLVALLVSLVDLLLGWNLFARPSQAIGLLSLLLTGAVFGSLITLFDFQRAFERKQEKRAVNAVRISALLSCAAVICYAMAQ